MTCFLAQFSDKSCSGRLIRAHLIPKSLLGREFPDGAFFASEFDDWVLRGRWFPVRRGTTLHEGMQVRSLREIQDDPRSWVHACGGALGPSGHHGMLDTARTLRIPREALPEGLEAFAVDYGLEWALEREYGPLDLAA